jgi:3-phosphoshikimate 1-carboxyvinyltransferase
MQFRVPAGQCYRGRSYPIEADATAASYFFAAAAITGGELTVEGLGTSSMQGDLAFVDLLEQMGARVIRAIDSTTVVGGPLHGIDADMRAVSDTALTLAVVAAFADGSTTIRNVAHIRAQETDRIHAAVTELARIGVGVQEHPDGMTISPAPLHGARIETYNDHRIAMSFALAGLRTPGIVISNPGCSAKTYPHFFDDLKSVTLS